MSFKKIVESYRDEIIRSTQELIRIRSVREEGSDTMPFGKGMSDALEYVLNLAGSMGFTVKNIDGYCGYAEYGDGDLYVGIMTHVDTCPEGELWAVPPFEGRIVNNRIYGRGTMDNKGPLMAALYGLKAVKDSGKKLNKKIRLIIGTDEERYYKDIEHYLTKEKPPIAGFTLDGQFPVVFAEKGLAMMEFRSEIEQLGPGRIEYIRGGTAENTVPGHCEAYLVTDKKSEIISKLSIFSKENRHNMTAHAKDDGVVIESFGVETHSMALEKGINAISPLIRFLNHVPIGDQAVREKIRFLDDAIGFDLFGSGFHVECEDEFSGKLTLNFGVVSLDRKGITVRLDLRYPVTCDFKKTSDKIIGMFAENGFVLVENTYWDPVYFPKEHFLIKALLKAYQEVTKDTSEPISSGSGSYSKVMPNIAAFGAIFPGESEAWHRVNEYIDIDSLVKLTEIYAAAAYELSSTL